MSHLQEFLLVFIPIFVAIDVLGMFPLFLSLTSGVDAAGRRRLSKQAVCTALVVAVVVILSGKWVFKMLGITLADLKVAGGLILLIIAIQDLTSATDYNSKKPADPYTLGIVPLGIPLILGPAVLTTLMILVDEHGFTMTVTGLVLNLAVVYGVFYFSETFERIVGKNGAGAIGKIASLLLAAIAVMMIRVGLVDLGIVKISQGS